MSVQKKRTPMGVFEILKSIMDAKAKPLYEAVDAGKRAQIEQPVLCEHISNMQRFIYNNRYDASDVHEAEADLSDYEYQLAGIQKKIEKGKRAAADLVYVDNFNKAYSEVQRRAKDMVLINELQKQCNVLEDDLSRLEDNIFACEVNMDSSVRSSDIVTQAKSDLEAYTRLYQEQSVVLDSLRAQIKELQK